MGRKTKLVGSYRPLPDGATLVSEADETERISVTIHLKRPRASTQERTEASKFADRSVPHDDRSILAKRIAEYTRATTALREFAHRHRLLLRLREGDCADLEGSVGQMSELFETTLHTYHDGHLQFRAHSGFVSVPDEIAPWTLAVMGLDQRPVAKHQLSDPNDKDNKTGLWPTEVAKIYDIPREMDAKGECVGVLAAGGGYRPEDVRVASARMDRPDVQIIPYPVRDLYGRPYPGNTFSGWGGADIEVSLDLQVLAGIIPGARIVVYFTANTAQGFMDAINQVLADGVNNPSVLSISWGGPEVRNFSPADCIAINECLAQSDRVLTVVAAAGDDLATAGLGDHQAHVLFPASSPHVIACGGTQLHSAANGTTAETVWKEGLKGTDGGISDVFDVPDYQRSLDLPPSYNNNRIGRGVPDVAAVAAQDPGYRIILNGREFSTYGTSAAAPFWAALIAMANAKRGRPGRKPLGAIHNYLYQTLGVCSGITEGNNQRDGIGYYAHKGWNACTGLGVPNGARTITGLASKPV